MSMPPLASTFSINKGSISNLPSISGSKSTGNLDPFRNKLVEALNIPMELTDHGDKTLGYCWQKYKAFLEAAKLCDEQWATGELTKVFDRKPSKTDIIGIFKGKTQWHLTYAKIFPKISNYPNMVDWLEEKEDRLSDLELWGVVKPVYGFSELSKWLEDGILNESDSASDTEVKGKGKKKGKGKGKGKGKKSRSESEIEFQTESEEKGKGKKKKNVKQAKGKGRDLGKNKKSKSYGM